ncbi:phosphonate C-P lyase system protein PhnG [Ramlibacter sp. G-1-2-2]|uniref:Phosphonate C-P lyase system protein PhnG n=1 Tax=Ramlibacter agri TaxID=2728837 RepID=A0A848GZ06_9BURK|nr:phosphonate C-P lyase system protein PhnG [Ramlibacter agri]NML42621.1 phosphonate C-P lyase system protein PhnG [Ramlibacter agri]
MTVQAESHETRKRWLAVLARAPREQLEHAVSRSDAPPHALVRAPECGMLMLRGRVGGTGDAFNFGEATVTRCAARIADFLGVGYVLGRDRRHAELVAVLDALLQDPARQPRLLAEVVEPLAREQEAARTARSREAAASRVEFFTMVRGEA